ncbi:hypothetical protein EI613_28660 [Azospirillum sp. 412522]|nr:hypothetical protein [Azospirillum sp. 412522]MBY6265859.1 hypothetical protein [Azospirillum sp. 412522]
MLLFTAWTSAVLGAARIDPPAALPARVPEPRRFRLAYSPVLPPIPVRSPLPMADGRLCLEK